MQLFTYIDHEVRVMDKDGEQWFLLKDVCEIMGLSDTNKVSERLDAEDLTRIVIVSGGQNREMLFVKEAGVYEAAILSRKPEAKKFRYWLTYELLPQLRKTGRYDVREREYQLKLDRFNVSVK